MRRCIESGAEFFQMRGKTAARREMSDKNAAAPGIRMRSNSREPGEASFRPRTRQYPKIFNAFLPISDQARPNRKSDAGHRRIDRFFGGCCKAATRLKGCLCSLSLTPRLLQSLTFRGLPPPDMPAAYRRVANLLLLPSGFVTPRFF